MTAHRETVLYEQTARIDAFAKEHALAGIAAGVLYRGELVQTYGVGETKLGNATKPTAESVFRIASMTKSFTASAILLLRDRKLLRLDDPIVEHLPWTSTIGAPANSDPITIRDLLTMNGGFPTDDPWGDRQENTPIEAFDAMVRAGLSFARAPGTGFEYSNLGYALLGRIVSRVSGRDYLDFVTHEVLQPLGMRATRFASRDVDEARRAHGYARVGTELVPEPMVTPGAFSPMGGLHSNVADLARWVRGFWSASSPENATLDIAAHPLARASRSEMQQSRTHVRTTFIEASEAAPAKTITGSYGYGLFIDLDSYLGRFVSHSGGYPGFGSHMRWHPHSGWGVIALSNVTYAPMRTLGAAIIEDLVARLPTPQEAASQLWPQTRDAMNVAEQLLRAWDDALADAMLAVNVDLDLPRTHRRAALRDLAESLGPEFVRCDETLRSDSPAHAAWHVRGSNGTRAELEIQLTPERPPRIQTLRAASVPN